MFHVASQASTFCCFGRCSLLCAIAFFVPSSLLLPFFVFLNVFLPPPFSIHRHYSFFYLLFPAPIPASLILDSQPLLILFLTLNPTPQFSIPPHPSFFSFFVPAPFPRYPIYIPHPSLSSYRSTFQQTLSLM